MSDADRQRLAERQARLVESLTAGAAAPDSFDEERVRLAARTLHNKRARGVAKAWPVLAAGLGERFDELFLAYASSRALSDEAAAADGRCFAEHLLRERILSDAARIELVSRRATRGWPVRIIRLGDVHQVVIAIRLFGAGVCRLFLPFPRAGRIRSG